MDTFEKKYKDMVQRARELHEAGNALTKKQMEIVCPELAESEDERIISNNIDEVNLLIEIQNYYEKNLAGLYITFSMYKRIARYFYSLGKKQK